MAASVTVIHVLGSLDIGGAERVALDLVRAAPRDIRQDFFCLGGREGDLADEFRQLGCRVWAARGPWPLSLLLQLLACRPSTVVSHVSLTSGVVLALAWVAGVPRRMARIHSTGDGRHGWARSAYRRLMRILLWHVATDVVAVNRAALAFAAGPRPPRPARRAVAHVVPNGVDTERFRPTFLRTTQAGALQVVHVGRGAPEKNRAVLPVFMEHLRAQMPAVLHLYGSPTDEDLGPYDAESVQNHGVVTNIPEVLSGADVLVLPSLREGQPGVILEALSMDVPVVAADIPGIRELAHLDGLKLVPLQASPAVWADALVRAGSAVQETRQLRESVLSSEYSLARTAGWWSRQWRR